MRPRTSGKAVAWNARGACRLRFRQLQDTRQDQHVVRREGTIWSPTPTTAGNYHPITARIYTDLSFFTCDAALGRDATKVFNYLSGYVQPEGWRTWRSADHPEAAPAGPDRAEADHAGAGRPAEIWAKMNSVIEPDVIDALYAASQAGVKISLVIRGICGLRPG